MTDNQVLALILLIVGVFLLVRGAQGLAENKGERKGADFICKTIKETDAVSELTKCACSPDCCVDEKTNTIVPCK